MHLSVTKGGSLERNYLLSSERELHYFFERSELPLRNSSVYFVFVRFFVVADLFFDALDGVCGGLSHGD